MEIRRKDSRLTAAVHLVGFAKPKHRRGFRILRGSKAVCFLVSANKKGALGALFFVLAVSKG